MTFLSDSNFKKKWNPIFQTNQTNPGDFLSGDFFPWDHFSGTFFPGIFFRRTIPLQPISSQTVEIKKLNEKSKYTTLNLNNDVIGYQYCHDNYLSLSHLSYPLFIFKKSLILKKIH